MIPATNRKIEWLADNVFTTYNQAANYYAALVERLKFSTTIAQQSYVNATCPAIKAKLSRIVNAIRDEITKRLKPQVLILILWYYDKVGYENILSRYYSYCWQFKATV